LPGVTQSLREQRQGPGRVVPAGRRPRGR
jgi:hypothetical protein